jgi:N-formylglutamate amidohydrolase
MAEQIPQINAFCISLYARTLKFFQRQRRKSAIGRFMTFLLANPVQNGSALVHTGNSSKTGPVILSIPHAGRDYPTALLASARLPMADLRALEDAWVDVLVQDAIVAGYTAIIATRARAAIDLNRAADDIDPAIVADLPTGAQINPTRRSESGLGLFPRLLPGHGALWRRRFTWADLQTRITEDYAPYHAAIGEIITQSITQYGGAILLDVHSMPQPRKNGRDLPVDFVFGTLHGSSCAPWLTNALENCVRSQGWRSQHNDPYAGGYILENTGNPAHNIHALQIEIARDLYLLPNGQLNPDGAATIRALLLDLAQAASTAWRIYGAPAHPNLIAAE